MSSVLFEPWFINITATFLACCVLYNLPTLFSQRSNTTQRSNSTQRDQGHIVEGLAALSVEAQKSRQDHLHGTELVTKTMDLGIHLFRTELGKRDKAIKALTKQNKKLGTKVIAERYRSKVRHAASNLVASIATAKQPQAEQFKVNADQIAEVVATKVNAQIAVLVQEALSTTTGNPPHEPAKSPTFSIFAPTTNIYRTPSVETPGEPVSAHNDMQLTGPAMKPVAKIRSDQPPVKPALATVAAQESVPVVQATQVSPTQFQGLVTGIETVKSERDNARGELVTEKQKVKNLRQELITVVTDLREAKDEMERNQRDSIAVQRKLQSQLDANTNRLQSANISTRSLEAQRTDLQSQLDAAKRELSFLSTSHSRNVDDARRNAQAELQPQLDQLRQELRQASSTRDTAQIQLKTAKEDLIKMQEVRKLEHETITNQQKDIGRLTTDLQTAHEDARSTIQQLHEEARSTIQQLHEELAGANAKSAQASLDAEAVMAKNQKEIDGLQAQLQKGEENEASMIDKLQKAEEQRKGLIDRIKELEAVQPNTGWGNYPQDDDEFILEPESSATNDVNNNISAETQHPRLNCSTCGQVVEVPLVFREDGNATPDWSEHNRSCVPPQTKLPTPISASAPEQPPKQATPPSNTRTGSAVVRTPTQIDVPVAITSSAPLSTPTSHTKVAAAASRLSPSATSATQAPLQSETAPARTPSIAGPPQPRIPKGFRPRREQDGQLRRGNYCGSCGLAIFRLEGFHEKHTIACEKKTLERYHSRIWFDDRTGLRLEQPNNYRGSVEDPTPNIPSPTGWQGKDEYAKLIAQSGAKSTRQFTIVPSRFADPSPGKGTPTMDKAVKHPTKASEIDNIEDLDDDDLPPTLKALKRSHAPSDGVKIKTAEFVKGAYKPGMMGASRWATKKEEKKG